MEESEPSFYNSVLLQGNREDNEKFKESEFTPFTGQSFLSEEEAFVFYRRYANHRGFSIRKGRFVTNNGIIKRRDIFCHREGKADVKIIDPSKEQRKRESSKCGCKAHLRITLQKCNDIFPSEWRVTKFFSEHNHELLAPSEVRLLPAYRIIDQDDRERVFLLKEAGLSIRQIMRVMELEKNVSHGHLPFLKKDVQNLFSKTKKEVGENDVMNLLKLCEDAKRHNAKFQFEYTVDAKHKLEHIFWSPSNCFDWYQKYGDVVVFDTTYKINAYDMPFGVFVGINNHGKTILFGCALLHNETLATFSWLMKTFSLLMKKPPTTILTDQDPWMTEAISKELPFTKHSFCIWHITSKFSGWFNALLREKYSKFCTEFFELYKAEAIQEFEQQWHEMVVKYGLECNKHIKGLYQVKKYWALAYLRDHFFGGMTTTGRSESINAFIKRFISSHTSLSDFFKQIDIAMQDIVQSEEHDIMLQKYKGVSLRIMSPLQEQAQIVLTRFAFDRFQQEFERCAQYSIQEKNVTIFILKFYKKGNSNEHVVTWHGETTTCSCKHFKFWGILCRHILSTFLHKDCYEIPLKYLTFRWQCEASNINNGIESLEQIVIQQEQERYITHVQDFVHCPSNSKPKGRPKQKQIKGGKELAKRKNTCGLCKGIGHNISTCSQKESDDFPSITKKGKKITSEDIGLNPILYLKDQRCGD